MLESLIETTYCWHWIHNQHRHQGTREQDQAWVLDESYILMKSDVDGGDVCHHRSWPCGAIVVLLHQKTSTENCSYQRDHSWSFTAYSNTPPTLITISEGFDSTNQNLIKKKLLNF